MEIQAAGRCNVAEKSCRKRKLTDFFNIASDQIGLRVQAWKALMLDG